MPAAAVLLVELRVGSSRSLKEKRTVVRHLLDTARARFKVAASEVGSQDLWQRAELGFAAVAPDPAQVGRLLDSVERFVWSHPEVEVIECDRHFLETEA